MKAFIQKIDKEIKETDKRYQSLCMQLEAGLEQNGGVDALFKKAESAKFEKAQLAFFKDIRSRYDLDAKENDMPAFVSYCLDLVKREFREYAAKDKAVTEATETLLRHLTPFICGAFDSEKQ